MTNSELLAKIKAEIERRIKENESWKDFHRSKGETTNFDDVKIVELQSILSFLSTLESEKPMNQDGLEEEINKFRIIFKNECDARIIGEIANHFALWGVEHLKK